MKVAAIVLTTNLKDRLALLDATINSIELCNTDLFDDKIISVDIFNNGCDIGYFDKFVNLGWRIVSGAASGIRGMAENQLRGLHATDADWIFYSEDDIIINKIPSKKTLNTLSSRGIGYICFNTHLPDNSADYCRDCSKYINIGDDLFFIKDVSIVDDYFLNFPVAILKRADFISMHAYSKLHCRGVGIEIAMTKSWIATGLIKCSTVVTYLKIELFNDILSGKIPQMPLHNFAQMKFFNNDPSLRHPSINNRRNSLV
jgi:hypothetical protein